MTVTSDGSAIEARIRSLKQQLRQRQKEVKRVRNEQNRKKKEKLKQHEIQLKKKLEVSGVMVSSVYEFRARVIIVCTVGASLSGLPVDRSKKRVLAMCSFDISQGSLLKTAKKKLPYRVTEEKLPAVLEVCILWLKNAAVDATLCSTAVKAYTLDILGPCSLTVTYFVPL